MKIFYPAAQTTRHASHGKIWEPRDETHAKNRQTSPASPFPPPTDMTGKHKKWLQNLSGVDAFAVLTDADLLSHKNALALFYDGIEPLLSQCVVISSNPDTFLENLTSVCIPSFLPSRPWLLNVPRPFKRVRISQPTTARPHLFMQLLSIKL